MEVIIIAAVANNRAIGKNNDLIWHLPDDMKFFKQTTSGRPVIMGRKNYESIPNRFRPLPNRENIIVTRNNDYLAEGATVVHNLDEALKVVRNEEEIYIIGGGEIYQLALDEGIVDTMFITQVNGSFEADAFFPEFDDSKWDQDMILDHPQDSKHKYGFTIFKYAKK